MSATRAVLFGCLLVLLTPGGLRAEGTRSVALSAIDIRRIEDPIQIDGHLDDAGWREVAAVSQWFETRPGDNIEPQVGSLAYLAYDDLFLYAAFDFSDPEPRDIRAPLANRDNVPSYTDYGGLIIDANNDGRTAQMFLANARGIQYDALSNDASGEDSSPDFFWDSAARVTETGWMLEMRIPFSSLRYNDSDPEQWGIMLYRNHPREFRYQMFTSRLPRDSTCFICNVRPLTGLYGLPSGGHWVVAPYISGNQASEPVDGVGTPLARGPLDGEVGLDAKWLPNPNTILDATINPDFSQIESDVAQIGANERFALFFPERRPFFLESADLLRTPIQAMYTRTFTSPRWGGRSTGTFGGNSYTFLLGEDRGGGSVIIPGSNSSEFASQDFESLVAMGRFRHDIGESFVSLMYSGREIDDGGHNRVVGPDFRWQVSEHDVISGQLLFSDSETPDRPDLADEWDGRKLSGHAAELWWYRQVEKWDFFALGNDLAEDFRADNGFVPQVGYRQGYGEIGRTFRPEDKPVSRLRMFTIGRYKVDQQGELLFREFVPGFGLDTLLSSFVRFEFAFDEVRGIERLFRRTQVRPTFIVRPGGLLSEVVVRATLGDEIDFANDRLGSGVTLRTEATIRPTDHLEMAINADRQWLDVTDEVGRNGRLFTADVARLRLIYTFTSRMWLRLIGQAQRTERDPDLYLDEVDERSESFAGSAVFAYKLNWQSVLYAGYGADRRLDDLGNLEPSGTEFFLKISYAFQH